MFEISNLGLIQPKMRLANDLEMGRRKAFNYAFLCFFNYLQARRADYFGVIPAHFFRRTAERLLLSQLRSSKVLFLFGRALKTQFPVC